MICSRDLLYADIDNRVAKANQDFNYVKRQTTVNGQLMQTLPTKNISIVFDESTNCDKNPTFNYIIKNGYHPYPAGYFKNYYTLNYTLYVVSNANSHTILFEDTGKRNTSTTPITDEDKEELFDIANTQIHSNLIGLMIKGAKRLGLVWGNESYNFIDIYPALKEQSCLALQASSNGFADMFDILNSDRFLEGRINKFYYDPTLKSTCIDYAYPNFFIEKDWKERFSVSQVTIGTYEFLVDNLQPDDTNRDIFYFITDNSTGIIVGMDDLAISFLLGTGRNSRTPNYIQNMTHGFDKIYTTFFYPDVNESDEFNINRPLRNSTIISADDGNDYYVTYYDSRGLVKYLYWAIIKYNHIGGVDAKWTVTPTILKFQYSQNYTISKTNLVLNNTGNYPISWIINTETTEGVKLDQESGTLQPKQAITLTASIDVQKRINDKSTSYFLAINPVLDLSTCFSSFVLACDYEEIDCKKSDIEVVENSTSGFSIILSYKWKEPKVCRDGIQLPENVKEDGYTLYNAPVSGKVIIYILFGINIIEYLTYLTLILIKPIYTRSVSPPIYFIIYIVGVLLGCIADILIVNDVHCYAQYATLAAAILIISTAFFFIIFDIYKKHEKKQFSTSGEWKFVCRIGILIIVLFGITMYLGYPLQFTKTIDVDGYDFSATVCGSENTIEQIAMFVLNFFLCLIILILCGHIISFGFSELPKAAKKEIFVAIIESLCSISLFIYKLVTIGTYPSSDTTFALYTVINLLAIIIMPVIMPITKFFRRETQSTNLDMKNLLFDDPIVRACLKLYLKEVLQEESMLFWEDACKYQMGYVKRSKEENDKLAHKLYSEYIADGSENEINISTSMKLRIKTAIDNKEITPGLYDEAIGEIQHLILTNNSYLFIQSKFGLLSENANMWFSEFNNFDNEIKEAIEDEVSYLLHGTDNKIQFRSTVMHLRKSTTRSSSISSRSSKPAVLGVSGVTTPGTSGTSGTDWKFVPNRNISNTSSQHAPSNPSNHGISIPGTVVVSNISPNDKNISNSGLNLPPSLPIKEPNGISSPEITNSHLIPPVQPTVSSPHEVEDQVERIDQIEKIVDAVEKIE